MKKIFMIIGKGTRSHLRHSLAVYQKILCVGLLGMVLLLGGCTISKNAYRGGMKWEPVPASSLIEANVRIETECKFTPEFNRLWKSWLNSDESIKNYQQASCDAIMDDMVGSGVFRRVVPPGDTNYDLFIKLVSINSKESEKISLSAIDPKKQDVIASYGGSAAFASSTYTAWNEAVRRILADIRNQMIGDNQEGKRIKIYLAGGKERTQSPSQQPQQAETVASDNESTDAIAYQQAKSLNTLQAFAEFLHAHLSSPSRREALEAMSLLIKEQNGSYESYRKFVAEYEDGLEFVPSQHRLALTGPEGIRIHDIIRLLKQGIKDTVIAAKIRTRNALYKDFDFEEIASLKKTGITDPLIEAMLDSTTRAKRGQEEFQKKKEMEDLLAEIQRTQKKLDAMKSAQEQQQQQQPQVAASGLQDSGQSLGDTVKNCAARVVALEACRHLSGFAQLICKATAKSQFPCQE